MAIEDSKAYARINSNNLIEIRGTCYPITHDSDWDGWDDNWFEPRQARNLAAYLVELADEAEKPKYEDGRYYEDADGDVYQWCPWNTNNKPWRDVSDGEFESLTFPALPLVKLVKETDNG